MRHEGILERPGGFLRAMRDRSSVQRALALCALLLAVNLFAAGQGSGTAIRNHFDSDAQMRAPGFFDFAVLGAPGPAEWVVLSDFNPPSAPNQVTQIVQDRPIDSIAAALRRSVSFVDGRLSIAVKRAGGRGGILFRMASEKDFLVLLVDSGSGDARLLSYRGGKPTELARGQAGFNVEWVVLEILTAGPEVRATWAGKPLLNAKDPAPAAGRAGMATAGPGPVSFDEFILEPASEKSSEKSAPPK
jgi:hypothetical protein